MLRIVALKKNQAPYFTNRAHHEYYSAGEGVAEWSGRGAQLLGLSGTVTPSELAKLFANTDPVSGRRLTARTKEGRRAAWDFNFHCPKSISVLYAITKDERIVVALQRAVYLTMLDIERDALVRVRRDGQDSDRRTANIIYCPYTHYTTRPVDGMPDPHLHVHVVCINSTYDEVEGRWKALQIGELKRDAPFFEALFHARLSNLVQELGYSVIRSGKSFELAGVDEVTVDKFSRRTAHIEKVAKKLGITNSVTKSKLGAATREKKRKDLSDQVMLRDWESRLTPAERHVFLNARSTQTRLRQATFDGQPELRAIEYARQHCFERASVVPVRRFLETALRYGVQGIDEARLQAIVAEHPGVIHQTVDGRVLVTCPEVVAEEKLLVAWARRGHGAVAALVPGHVVRDERLTEEQRRAIRHVLESTSRLTGIQGRAGTGKTSLMKEAISAIESQGHRVTVLAPTAKAARVLLRGEGFPEAETVQQLLGNEELQQRAAGGVLWIDEANLLSVRGLKRVTDLADRIGARLVATGDSAQHAAVERGSPIQLLEQYADVRFATIGSIRRQRGVYREAVEDLSQGRMAEGFAKLDGMGAIREIACDEDRNHQLATDYLRALRDGASALVISPTHAECKEVTDVIRRKLKESGEITQERSIDVLKQIDFTEAERGDAANYRHGMVIELLKSAPGHRAGQRLHVSDVSDGRVYIQHSNGVEYAFDVDRYAERFSVYEQDRIEVGQGDRLLVTKNGPSLNDGKRLHRGTLHTVVGFTDDGDIRLDNGLDVSRHFCHVNHGICVTSHSSQGMTVDRVYISESSASFAAASRQQFYVSVSRGRELVRVYTDDREALLEAVHASGERLAALDIIRDQAPGHDVEIRHAELRSELNGEVSESQVRSKSRLGQIRDVPDRFPKKSLDEMQQYRRDTSFDR